MIIYAVNVHTGGGKVLLDTLLLKSPFDPVTTAFIDGRYEPPANSTAKTFFRSFGKLWGRFKAEINLHAFLQENTQTKKTETVLFFGNIPPFFKCRTPSALYLQNCFLTRQVPLPQDSKKEMLRNWIESILLRLFHRNVGEIWVQTEWMKTSTLKLLPKAQVLVKPILPLLKPAEKSLPKLYQFIFVGSLALNKRLDFFLESLHLVDQDLDKQISVAIVLDNSADLEMQTERTKNKFKHIELKFFNRISREALSELYQQSETFVATSRYESFCLPIYEARFYGCKIIIPYAGYSENLDFPTTRYEINSESDLATKMFQEI